MVRVRLWVALSLVLLVAAMALAGCGGSSTQEAQTPRGAKTVMNTAVQTDSQGKTVTAPSSTGAATGGTTSAAGGGGAPAGDKAAGQTVFASHCTACHLNNGTGAGGVGPKLAGMGLTADRITQQIKNGGGPMPANLVSGTDLTNVVAYVLSLQ